MIDHKSGKKNNRPAQYKQRPKYNSKRVVFRFPNNVSHRPPLPEQQDHYDVGGQYISRAFYGFRDDFCPPAFKPWTCHDAVLKGKQSQQDGIIKYTTGLKPVDLSLR